MPDSKNVVDENWPTIFELASEIAEMDLSLERPPSRKNAKSVVHGLTPKPFPIKEKYLFASVEQVLSLRVPVIEVQDGIKGFQREKLVSHARKIARAMLAGKEIPPAIISVFPDEKAYASDGQHRAIGAVIAKMPLECVVKHRTVEQARELFANQTRAKKVRADDTLVTGNSPIELYIQDALTSSNHAWSDIVGQQATDRRISPTTMAVCVGAYVFDIAGPGGAGYMVNRPVNQWNEDLANELASLIIPFGTKMTNPIAFRGASLRAVSSAAVHIIRRSTAWRGEKDFERWNTHMPKFDFAKYPHVLNKSNYLADELVKHWNKRLPEKRLVKPFSYPNG